MVGVGEMVAAAVIKEVVSKVSALLLQVAVQGPAKRIQSFKEDLEEMKSTLEIIQTTMADAEERSINNHSERLWLKRLKMAGYEISDLLDEFQHGSPPGKLQGPSWYKVMLSGNMAKKMKNVKKKLKQITEQRKSYGTSRIPEPNNVTAAEPESTSIIGLDVIVGRGVEKQSVINILLSCNNKARGSNTYPKETSHCTVIYGLAGVGKTELAKLVFNDERIQEAFPQRAWVFVHENYGEKDIGRDIISRLKDRTCDLMILESIYQHLKKVIQSRCLIVLDNLWNSSHLTKLQGILGSNVSILVTSRRYIRLNMPEATFCLDPLSDKLSFDLVKQVASPYFPEDDIPETVIKEIVKVCRGVPLALKCVASLLKPERSVDVLLSLIKAIFPPKSDYGTTDIQQTVFASLKLTYHLMKPRLKLCFAYCAIFAKGCEIDREDLCHQWIALGLTEKTFSEDNVRELLVMSFLQDSEPPSDRGDDQRGGEWEQIKILKSELALCPL